MWGILASYVIMYIAQTKGGDIVGAIHGSEAAEKALSGLVADAVQPDLDLRDLCNGYAAAHFDSASNILHAAGMVATLWLFVYATTLFFFGFGKFQHYLYLPPLYYLPAWVGHFIFQKDIPAVFTYGTTPKGLLSGEFCAFEDLFHGGIARNPTEMMYSGMVLVAMIGSLLAFGGLWPESSPKQPTRKGTKQA
jgi:hypothetical protein